MKTKETKNSALAGVGSPIKLFFWFSEILNFDSLNAEKIVIKNAQ